MLCACALCPVHGEQAYRSKKIDIGIGNRNRLNIIPFWFSMLFSLFCRLSSSAFCLLVHLHKTCNFPLWLSLDTMPLISSINLVLCTTSVETKKWKRKIHQATEEEDKAQRRKTCIEWNLASNRPIHICVLICNMQLNVSLYHCAILLCLFAYECKWKILRNNNEVEEKSNQMGCLLCVCVCSEPSFVPLEVLRFLFLALCQKTRRLRNCVYMLGVICIFCFVLFSLTLVLFAIPFMHGMQWQGLYGMYRQYLKQQANTSYSHTYEHIDTREARFT